MEGEISQKEGEMRGWGEMKEEKGNEGKTEEDRGKA